MNEIKEKLENVKNDLINPNQKHIHSDDFDTRLKKIKDKRVKIVSNDKENKEFVEIKHQIENLFGADFCSSKKFLNFIDWVKSN